MARGRKPRPRDAVLRSQPGKENETMLFQKGQSGNPAGRPRGSRNRSKLLFQDRLDADVAEIADKVVALAKAGDIAAIRLCVDRLLPVRKSEPVEFELPPFETAGFEERLMRLERARQMARGSTTAPRNAQTSVGLSVP
jgi:hypothetical protein